MGQSEDYSQKTASQTARRNCSEEARGDGQYICVAGEGGRAVQHTFWQRVAASHKKLATS